MDENYYLRNCFPFQKIGYGLGHVFNDLCAAMWFSYTLFYFQVVLDMKSTLAGTLLMTGQVIDALATPLAGWAIDFTGNKKLWHLLGTVCVALGFPLIFSLHFDNFTPLVIIRYALVIVLFQIGWALVQISHLSIIPEISRNQRHSSDLTAIRYTASVCCSVVVYLITLSILKNNGVTNNIGPDDFYKFKEIALIITFIGLLASMLFYCGLLANNNEDEYDVIRESQQEDANGLNNGNGFIIYCVALMYMSSRLFTTLNLIYIPLFIDERGSSDGIDEVEEMREAIATVPLVTYLSSFVTSLFLKYRSQKCNDKVMYLMGVVFGITVSIWIGIGVVNMELYFIAILLGLSGSSTMVASLCLTANFVKINGERGGKVYGIVTFTDKLISGGVVLLVQHLRCSNEKDCPEYYKDVLTYICGLVSFAGLISLIFLHFATK